MSDAPGLKKVKLRGGTAYYWVAARASRLSKDYRPRSVRLTGATHDERALKCRALTDEMHAWLEEQACPPERFDGTVAALIRCYQHDEESPYRDVRAKTRKEYDYATALIKNAVGEQIVETITGADIRRWYREAREPAKPGGPERIRRAQAVVKLLRIMANYGATEDYDGCAKLAFTLSKMRFEQPARREEALSYAQADAIVRLALDQGQVSMALGQALQFETTLRQSDVVGWWETNQAGNITGNITAVPGGLIHAGRRWTGGVLWSDVSPDLVLAKKTSKNAAKGEWDLRLCPLVMLVLQHVPPEKRIGPMIVCESTGRPYQDKHYSRAWRKLARSCGVPDGVWNRDSRAGGITEGFAAGADPRDVQSLATHSDPRMTDRYNRSGTLGQTSKVAQLRMRKREE